MGMLRMSFLEHLEELRSRIIKSIAGRGGRGLRSASRFSSQLWTFVCQPAVQALKALGLRAHPGADHAHGSVQHHLVQAADRLSPFLSRRRGFCTRFGRSSRRACTGGRGDGRRRSFCARPGCSLLGGVFAYFVVFRYGLTFLLSIGQGNYVKPMVSITEYFDLFVNVMLGVGLVFEMPVLIFFLTLLRISAPLFCSGTAATPSSGIFIIAAVVTPTPDVFNLMLFATPMCLLFYVGIFAGYLLVLHRENRRFPWGKVLTITISVLLLLAVVIYLAITRYGYRVVPNWPFLMH